MSLPEGTPIDAGTTPGLITLTRDAESGVFVLDMLGGAANPENRLTTDFGRAIHTAFDAAEDTIRSDPPGTPAALLTISSSPKFFSNGIDPVWLAKASEEERKIWEDLAMPAFARPILLPCPTVCAVNGHGFGAGMMHALAHDHRIQALEKGYLCAIEVAIGIPTPPPEMTLFQHSMPASAFYQTILEAKRWTAQDAFDKGIVQAAVPGSELRAAAFKEAAKLAKLTSAGAMGYTKWATKGFVAKEILEHTFRGGKQSGSVELPPGLAAHIKRIVVEQQKPWTAKLGEFRSKI